jgi:hypothetical protein
MELQGKWFDFADGSFATETSCPRHVRFALPPLATKQQTTLEVRLVPFADIANWACHVRSAIKSRRCKRPLYRWSTHEILIRRCTRSQLQAFRNSLSVVGLSPFDGSRFEDRNPSFNEENTSWPICDQRGVREGQV